MADLRIVSTTQGDEALAFGDETASAGCDEPELVQGAWVDLPAGLYKHVFPNLMGSVTGSKSGILGRYLPFCWEKVAYELPPLRLS